MVITSAGHRGHGNQYVSHVLLFLLTMICSWDVMGVACPKLHVTSSQSRWGKTVLGMDRLIHPALQGKPVAWFAPNYRLLSDVWRELQATLGPVIARTNQQEWRLELRGGGVVEMWSLDSPDSGRGRAYAIVVVDECALVPDLAACL